MGGTICSRVSLLKWIISPHNCKWRYTHDADQWQVPEEVLSLMVSFSADQVKSTPLIKTRKVLHYHPTLLMAKDRGKCWLLSPT